MRYILIMLVCSVQGALFGQTAYFETTIYIEDAIGNIDSVIIGYDPVANDEFNPDFGEVDIDTPFDSVLDSRAIHFDAYFDRMWQEDDILMSKKIITETAGAHNSEDCFVSGASIFLAIHAKYKPIRIYWDPSDYNTSYCRSQSVILEHQANITLFPWWYDIFLERSQCMGETSFYNTYLSLMPSFPLFTVEEIIGLGQDTVKGIQVYFSPYGNINSYCREEPVATFDIEATTSPLLYPNPTTNQVRFNDQEDKEYVVYDLKGQIIQTGKSDSINLENYASGIFLIIYKSGDKYYSEKVVKMD